MLRLYEVAQIREIEQLAFAAGIDQSALMQRAGQFAYATLRQRWPEIEKLIVCTGKGNNAGDGFVLACLAHLDGIYVEVYAICDPKTLSGAALEAANRCLKVGVPIKIYHADLPFDGDVTVDALLGIGLQGEVREPYITAINTINDHNTEVLALDVPSGIDADTGSIQGAAIDADVTVSFIGLKQGLYTRKGATRCGELLLGTLDIPAEIVNRVAANAEVIDWEHIRAHLPKRLADSHKGDYGHVLIIGGEYGMGGAVRMAAEGALRVGAGLVSVATRPEHVSVVGSSRPEIMCYQVGDAEDLIPLIEKATIIVIGPGLGRSPWAEMLLKKVLKSNKQLLLDADALNLLSEMPLHRDNWILTPHPGEAARLLKSNCQELQEQRFQAVRDLQANYGGVIALKGAGTLVKGAQALIHLCRAGNPGMASGGMGDVLSGIIAGFVAQGIDPLVATQMGVYVHARAGDLAVEEGGGERGLLATDVFAYLRKLVNP